MSASRYARSLDLDDLNAHTYGVLLTPPGSDVIDIGTADGHPVVSTLVARGCTVWGVEIDEVAAAAAAPLCADLVVGNVEELDLGARWPDLEVDTILCLDVLEHLVDPAETLRSLLPLLRPGGRVVISLPNVSHAAVRLQLLGGKFTYTDTGLLDGTHLRFFDREGAHTLVAAAGFHVVEELAVLREVHETEIPIDLEEVSPEVLAQVRADPDARVFQWILVAQAGPSVPQRADDPQGPEARGLATALWSRIGSLESSARQTADYVAGLQEQIAQKNAALEGGAAATELLQARLEDLDATLRVRSAELDDATVALRAAQAALALKDDYIAELERQADGAVAPPVPDGPGARDIAREALVRHPSAARLARRTYRALPPGVQRRLKA